MKYVFCSIIIWLQTNFEVYNHVLNYPRIDIFRSVTNSKKQQNKVEIKIYEMKLEAKNCKIYRTLL